MENISIYNVDIAICNLQRTTKELEFKTYSDISPLVLTNLDALRQLYRPNGTAFTVACGKLYKKSLFDSLRFPVGRLHEDEFLTYKLINMSDKIVFLDLPLYFYFQREGSITGSGFTPKRAIDSLDAMIERFYYFKMNKIGLLEESYFSVVTAYSNSLIYLTNDEKKIIRENSIKFKNFVYSNKIKLKKIKRRIITLAVVHSPLAFKVLYTLKSRLLSLRNN
jgi:hypothetical protein